MDKREEADIKFKAISQAYEILYDDEQREMYDLHGMSAFEGGRPGMAGGDMQDILNQMFGGMPGMGGRGGPGSKPRKGPDDETVYPVTLEVLYQGKTQKFAITKNVVCSQCKGKGGKENAKPKECQSCKGRGKLS